MDLTNLNAISPVDGRYGPKVNEFSAYFSEFGLIKYRLTIEIEYFAALSETLDELNNLSDKDLAWLRSLLTHFDEEEAEKVKALEKVTNHDVKALEYYLKEKFDEKGWSQYREFIHFGLTSQDINNTAIPLSLKEAVENHFLPFLKNSIIGGLKQIAKEWWDIPMLAHTHGQPATPTRLGKEIQVFVERLEKQTATLKDIAFECKFGGATGNFNAHYIAYPDVDWLHFGDRFAKEYLGLQRQQFTTQIDHYDNLATFFDTLKRINTILIDFSRDCWNYISMDYFGQQLNDNEVGSSVMPHKVNPIDFENAEGNLGLANSFLNHLSEKLPISRMQRDLTDSTVTRNIGMPLSYTFLALKSLKKGFDKITVNQSKLNADLDANWAILAEPIQTVLRKEGYQNPYETLKFLTRKSERIDKKAIHEFIETLEISPEAKNRLKALTPHNYLGKNPSY